MRIFTKKLVYQNHYGKLIRPRFLLNIVRINRRASGQCSSSAHSFNCLKTISSQVFYWNLQLNLLSDLTQIFPLSLIYQLPFISVILLLGYEICPSLHFNPFTKFFFFFSSRMILRVSLPFSSFLLLAF